MRGWSVSMGAERRVLEIKYIKTFYSMCIYYMYVIVKYIFPSKGDEKVWEFAEAPSLVDGG